MKRYLKEYIGILMALALIILLAPAVMAYDHTIDGDLSDWGLSKLYTGDWSQNDTWVPDLPGIRFVVEDNYDNDLAPYTSYVGVHIVGVSPSYTYYDEPYQEPIGEELYDVEAMYVDENDTHIFVALVVSAESWAIGDLALNLDADVTTGGYGYEFGVKLNTTSGVLYGIYETPNDDCWTEPIHGPASAPATIDVNNATYMGINAVGAWVDMGVSDWGRTNYVIELAIPKSAVGMDGKNLADAPLPKVIRLAEPCGNEDIPITIPEFISMLVPIMAIIGLACAIRLKLR